MLSLQMAVPSLAPPQLAVPQRARIVMSSIEEPAPGVTTTTAPPPPFTVMCVGDKTLCAALAPSNVFVPALGFRQ